MKVTYNTIHRAEIEIPKELEHLCQTPRYSFRAAQISSESRVGSSGSDTYSPVYEWVEKSDNGAVMKWVNFWLEFLNELRADNTEEKRREQC